MVKISFTNPSYQEHVPVASPLPEQEPPITFPPQLEHGAAHGPPLVITHTPPLQWTVKETEVLPVMLSCWLAIR